MQLSKRKMVRVIIIVFIYLLFLLFWSARGYMSIKTNEIRKNSISIFLNEMSSKKTFNLATLKSGEVIDYMAILEIPKIGLKQGLMDINSRYNDINYNIAIHELSDMPDKEKGNFILMAHSGSSGVSYFKDLDDLEVDDEVNVYYGNMKYVYQVGYIYEEEKTGIVNIDRDITRSSLTMTTCSDRDDDKQLVVISYLILKEEY